MTIRGEWTTALHVSPATQEALATEAADADAEEWDTVTLASDILELLLIVTATYEVPADDEQGARESALILADMDGLTAPTVAGTRRD